MSQVVLVVKKLPANAGDVKDEGLIPASGRSPGGGHGNPLQYSCLEHPMDRRACGDRRACSPWGHEESDATEVTQQAYRVHPYERQAFQLTTVSTKASECVCTYAWPNFLVCYCPGSGSLLRFHFCIKLSGDTCWHQQYLWFINWLSQVTYRAQNVLIIHTLMYLLSYCVYIYSPHPQISLFHDTSSSPTISPNRESRVSVVSEQMKDQSGGTFLVAQWLRICFATQRTQVQSLVGGLEPTCRGAPEPESGNH